MILARLKRNEKGFTLIEVLVALAITSLIVVAFLMAMNIAHRATFISNERTTAESLARSQMEDIKNEPYINYSDPLHGVYVTTAYPTGYGISFTVIPFDPGTGNPYSDLGGGIFDGDDGIQKIAVTVDHNGNDVLTLEGYKVDR